VRRLCASILVVALPACGGDDAAPPPGRGVGQPTDISVVPADPADNVMVRPEGDRPPKLVPTKRPTTIVVEEPAPPGTPPPPPPRDFAGELMGIAGDPMSCMPVDAVPPATQEFAIELEAVVTAGGTVTRAYARAPGLPADAVDCIQARMEAGRFRAPVEGGPRTVRAVLHLRRRTVGAQPAAP
jgi:hypothetical protein